MRDRIMTARRWVTAPDADEVPWHQAGGLAALRVLLGLLWLYNLFWKVPPDFGEDSGKGLYKFTAFAVEHPVLPPYSWLVENAILPNIEVFGWLVLASETALAVMLLTGSYIRVAAILGIAQSGAIALSVAYAPEEWPWAYWLMMGAHLALLVASSGRVLSVDAVRAGLTNGSRLMQVWGVVAVGAGLVSVLGSTGDPLAARGPALGSSDPSISLGSYNLLGGLVLALVGAALLAGSAGYAVVARAGAAIAVAAAVLQTVQRGFFDPWLGGTATSTAVYLILAVVALGVTAGRTVGEPDATPGATRATDETRT